MASGSVTADVVSRGTLGGWARRETMAASAAEQDRPGLAPSCPDGALLPAAEAADGGATARRASGVGCLRSSRLRSAGVRIGFRSAAPNSDAPLSEHRARARAPRSAAHSAAPRRRCNAQGRSVTTPPAGPRAAPVPARWRTSPAVRVRKRRPARRAAGPGRSPPAGWCGIAVRGAGSQLGRAGFGDAGPAGSGRGPAAEPGP